MDRLPKHRELVFERARNKLYSRLSKVILALGNKFDGAVNRERVQGYVHKIDILMDPAQIFVRTAVYGHVFCVCGEIRRVIPLYQLFLIGMCGDKRSTKKIYAGVKRLEWLVENWDGLEITGDTRSGYRLELKWEESNDNHLQ